MANLRFFYTGKDLEEGEKYLKSSNNHKYENWEDVLNDYKDILRIDSESKHLPHTAKCPAVNKLNISGWISFNHYDLVNDPELSASMESIFPNYPNAKDYIITKFVSAWKANIPKGYYLMSVPTLYQTNEYFSLPGIIDSGFKQYIHNTDLNSFVVMKKNTTIKKESPIAQWILVNKDPVSTTIEMQSDQDENDINERDTLNEIKQTCPHRYKEILNSELFKDKNHG